jgi:ribosome-binding protein aMBF1 (putative translation factor)
MFHKASLCNVKVQILVMTKASNRIRSRYTDEALLLLGKMVRAARIERKWSSQELATRTDISRPLLKRIEEGDPGCSIGAVFEVAAILGIKLFNADMLALSEMRRQVDQKLALLPSSVRKPVKVKDDF